MSSLEARCPASGEEIVAIERVIAEAAFARVADVAPARRTGTVRKGRSCPHRGVEGAHLHGRIKALVNGRCRGVATRNLPAYLGWHRAMLRKGFTGKALLDRALGVSVRRPSAPATGSRA